MLDQLVNKNLSLLQKFVIYLVVAARVAIIRRKVVHQLRICFETLVSFYADFARIYALRTVCHFSDQFTKSTRTINYRLCCLFPASLKTAADLFYLVKIRYL